ncbi:pseudouridylate synthase [Plasmodium vinckei petteri]|uniref:Pseudouridine synthase, putative n=1 Tax=Plasmodium vinckei petteri TaxID=138298 RepID=W7ADW2_PLAVN|nr:pseudouridylate synthase [Plasmodium vinckei petteri]CAD2097194.1 pseudouridine synthase, putative [Plasmodium vinckei petteri]
MKKLFNAYLKRYVLFLYLFLLLFICIKKYRTFTVLQTNCNKNENIIRLNKLISINNKISRRKADKFIQNANIKINNKIVLNPGTHVDITKDQIKVNEKKINIQNIKKIINNYNISSTNQSTYKWIVLHKPKGLLCTNQDEKDRKSIFSIFPDDLLQKYRIVSVGRLDRNTSGVLLLTNEYAWINKLTHPKYERVRKYMIHIEGPVRMDALKTLADGVYLKDEYDSKKKNQKTQPALIEILREENVKIQNQIKKISVLNISIKEGRNRQIRKMFQQINQPIIKIKRTAFENITLKNIRLPKQYRELTKKEITSLKTRDFLNN